MVAPSAHLLTVATFANGSSSASAFSTAASKTPARRLLAKLARHALAASLLVLVVLGAALPSLATTYTVTSTADGGTGSLRAALGMAANGDTINFSLTYPATITLTSGYLDITTNVTISGPGPANLAISGGNNINVFQVEPTVPSPSASRATLAALSSSLAR